MSTDRETTRLVRSWLEEGATALPDRVLDAVLDQVPATPQRSAWWPARRYADMNNIPKVALSAAAVVVVAVIGINLLPGVGGGPGGAVASPSAATPSASPAPTPSPVASPSTAAGDGLPLGPFVLTSKGEGIAMSATIAADGWDGEAGGGILVKNDSVEPPDGSGMIVFNWGDGWYVPGDPCQYDSTMPATRSTTVDDLIAALAAQSSRDASAPADITLDGYAGKSIILHVPDDAVFADCDHGKFCTLADPEASPVDACLRYHQGPGQIDNLWVVDVDGQLVVIDWGNYAETPPEDVAELEAIVRSITFE